MNEEIIKVIDAIAEKFGIVIDWTSENVMPLVTETLNQLILYKQMINIIWFVVLTFMAIALYKNTNKTDKILYNECLETKVNNNYYWYDIHSNTVHKYDDRNFYIGLRWTVIIVVIILVVFSLNNFIKVTFAPNIYILEYLKKMM